MNDELPPIHAKTTKANFLEALEHFKDIDENVIWAKRFGFSMLEGPAKVTIFSADTVTTGQGLTSKYTIEIKVITTNYVPNAWRTEDK